MPDISEEDQVETGPPSAFYEVRIKDVLYQVSRQRIDDLAADLAARQDSSEDAVAEAFKRHPDVELNVEVTIDATELF